MSTDPIFVGISVALVLMLIAMLCWVGFLSEVGCKPRTCHDYEDFLTSEILQGNFQFWMLFLAFADVNY